MPHPNINSQSHLQTTLPASEMLLDLNKLVETIISFWKIIVLSICLSMLIAFILALVIPKKWEASVTLQIGRVPTINKENQIDASKYIEDPDQIVERIKLRGFREKLLTDLGLPIEENVDNRTDLLISSLKGDSIRGTDFVNLSARGYSPDDARNTLINTVQEIKKQHASITEPIKSLSIKDLSDVNNQLDIANNSLAVLRSSMNHPQKDISFSTSIVAIDLLNSKQSEVNTLKSKSTQLQTLLNITTEYSTKIINNIHVTKHAVFPKKSTFLILGALFGAFFGIGLALIQSTKHPT